MPHAQCARNTCAHSACLRFSSKPSCFPSVTSPMRRHRSHRSCSLAVRSPSLASVGRRMTSTGARSSRGTSESRLGLASSLPQAASAGLGLTGRCLSTATPSLTRAEGAQRLSSFAWLGSPEVTPASSLAADSMPASEGPGLSLPVIGVRFKSRLVALLVSMLNFKLLQVLTGRSKLELEADSSSGLGLNPTAGQ